jgi:prophage tail gpP-like protein
MSGNATASATITTTVSARHMTVIVNGRVLKTYTMAECGRDLGDICGAFHVEYLDEWRAASLLGDPLPEWVGIKENDPVEIRIHGETVLKGWVDEH